MSKEFYQLPQYLREKARTDLGTDYCGSIKPGTRNLLAKARDIKIFEVKIHRNVEVLEPGEAAISGGFLSCSAVIARKKNKLYLMHVVPNRAGTTIDFIHGLTEQGIIDYKDDIFDEILLLGKEASLHYERFSEISRKKPQIISLASRAEREFSACVQ